MSSWSAELIAQHNKRNGNHIAAAGPAEPADWVSAAAVGAVEPGLIQQLLAELAEVKAQLAAIQTATRPLGDTEQSSTAAVPSAPEIEPVRVCGATDGPGAASPERQSPAGAPEPWIPQHAGPEVRAEYLADETPDAWRPQSCQGRTYSETASLAEVRLAEPDTAAAVTETEFYEYDSGDGRDESECLPCDLDGDGAACLPDGDSCEAVAVAQPAPEVAVRVPGAQLQPGQMVHETELSYFRTGCAKRQREHAGGRYYVIHAGGKYYGVAQSQYRNPQGRETCTVWYAVLSVHAGYKSALAEAQRLHADRQTAVAAKPAPAVSQAPRLDLEAAIAAHRGPYAVDWQSEWGNPWRECTERGGRVLLLACAEAKPLTLAGELARKLAAGYGAAQVECFIGAGGALVLQAQDGKRRSRYEIACRVHGPENARLDWRAVAILAEHPGTTDNVQRAKPRELILTAGSQDRDPQGRGTLAWHWRGAPIRVIEDSAGNVRLDGWGNPADKAGWSWRTKAYMKASGRTWQYTAVDMPIAEPGTPLGNVNGPGLLDAGALAVSAADKLWEQWEVSKRGYAAGGYVHWQAGGGWLTLTGSQGNRIVWARMGIADSATGAGLLLAADLRAALKLMKSLARKPGKLAAALPVAVEALSGGGLKFAWAGGEVCLAGQDVRYAKTEEISKRANPETGVIDIAAGELLTAIQSAGRLGRQHSAEPTCLLIKSGPALLVRAHGREVGGGELAVEGREVAGYGNADWQGGYSTAHLEALLKPLSRDDRIQVSQCEVGAGALYLSGAHWVAALMPYVKD